MKQTTGERLTTLETIIPTICDDIHDIKTNHLVHIQDSMEEVTKCISSMKRDTIELKTDMSWLKKFFWVIAGASIGGLVTSLLGLILK